MPVRHALLPALLILLVLSSMPAISRGQSGAREIEGPNSAFTIDIPILTDRPARVIGSLQRRGIPLIGATIEGDRKPAWTHILAGRFGSTEAAARYGDSLVALGIIEGFFVRPIASAGAPTRPRRVGPVQQHISTYESTSINSSAKSFLPSTEKRPGNARDVAANHAVNESSMTRASRRSKTILALAPRLDPELIPRPDPALVALDELIPNRARREGGLWLAGDVAAAVSRLEWIVGYENSSILSVESDGRVKLNTGALLRLSRADRVRAGADLVVADYIRSNEGLYLLTQLTGAARRYCFYLGQRLPTAGREVPVSGSINLDNNFDRRVNPYRKDGMKLPQECPPDGFDAIIAINPAALWFNDRTRRLVPGGMIAFHELAEALAKVDYGLEYLPVGFQAGAHDIAIQREIKLSSERPKSDVVTTVGSNHVFGTEKGFLEFRAELHEARGGR